MEETKKILDNKIEGYAKLLMSMSTDYLMGGLETEHYCNMVALISDQMVFAVKNDK